MKVCLVGSSGGHLTHLYMLKPFLENKDRFWVTFDKEDARSLLKGLFLLLSDQPEYQKPAEKYSGRMEGSPQRATRPHYFLRRGRRGAVLLFRKAVGGQIDIY